MKKILIGLIILCSLSTFANETTSSSSFKCEQQFANFAKAAYKLRTTAIETVKDYKSSASTLKTLSEYRDGRAESVLRTAASEMIRNSDAFGDDVVSNWNELNQEGMKLEGCLRGY